MGGGGGRGDEGKRAAMAFACVGAIVLVSVESSCPAFSSHQPVNPSSISVLSSHSFLSSVLRRAYFSLLGTIA